MVFQQTKSILFYVMFKFGKMSTPFWFFFDYNLAQFPEPWIPVLSVYSLVWFQVCGTSELRATNITVVGFLFTVTEQMRFEESEMTKHSTADSAWETLVLKQSAKKYVLNLIVLGGNGHDETKKEITMHFKWIRLIWYRYNLWC